MDGLRVRRGGVELQVDNLDALFRLASEGKLKRSDEVLTARGWVRAADLPQFKARFGADPWDAWSDVDAADAEAVYRGYVGHGEAPGAMPTPRPPTPRPPAPPPPASPPPASPPPASPPPASPPPASPPPSTDPATDPTPVPVRAAPIVQPDPAAPPHPDLPPAAGARPAADERGQVIAFPAPAPPRRATQTLPVHRDRGPRPVPLIRWSWLLLWVSVGLCLLAVTWWWIRFGGSSRDGIDVVPPAPIPTERAANTPPAATVGAYTRASSSPYGSMEQELRNRLVGEVRPVTAPGQLGDALLIDLQNLQVDVSAVDAVVTQWSGRQSDVPRKAEVHVTLGSDTELDRELAGVALAVGRYKRALRLDIPLVEVKVTTGEGELRTTLDAKKAEELYIGRISLDQFFLAQKGG